MWLQKNYAHLNQNVEYTWYTFKIQNILCFVSLLEHFYSIWKKNEKIMNYFSSTYFVTMTWALLGFNLVLLFFKRRSRLCANGDWIFDRIILIDADETLIDSGSSSVDTSKSTATALPVPTAPFGALKTH